MRTLSIIAAAFLAVSNAFAGQLAPVCVDLVKRAGDLQAAVAACGGSTEARCADLRAKLKQVKQDHAAKCGK